jgi:hypothetical protein
MRGEPNNQEGNKHSLRSWVRSREKLLFTGASGIGWMIDFSVFSSLIYGVGADPFLANYLSSIAGSAFAFSAYCMLSAAHGYSPRVHQIAAYVAYQIVSITFYAWLVDAAANAFSPLATIFSAVLAKISVTPLNFFTNYLSTRTVLRFLRPMHLRSSQ